jgi:hypothetical protein
MSETVWVNVLKTNDLFCPFGRIVCQFQVAIHKDAECRRQLVKRGFGDAIIIHRRHQPQRFFRHVHLRLRHNLRRAFLLLPAPLRPQITRFAPPLMQFERGNTRIGAGFDVVFTMRVEGIQRRDLFIQRVMFFVRSHAL